MIHKSDIYTAFGKKIPTDNNIVDPFIDTELQDSDDSISIQITEELSEPIRTDDVTNDAVGEKKNNITAPSSQDYRHYGFLRTAIVLAIIVLGFALAAEQQDIIHSTIQNIALYLWYPLIIIVLALGLLWYKSWIGKIIGGIIVLFVVGALSYMELYDSLAINNPVHISRSQSVYAGDSTSISLTINDVVSDIAIKPGQANSIDMTRSGERSINLQSSSGTVLLSGSNIWNIITRPTNTISVGLPIHKHIQIFSKQLWADNTWDLGALYITQLHTIGGSLQQDITVPSLGTLEYIIIQSRWSDLNLHVPSDIGIEVQLDNWIDIKELADLEQIDTDMYRSKNFAQTDKHLRIRIDSVISSFTLHRD